MSFVTASTSGAIPATATTGTAFQPNRCRHANWAIMTEQMACSGRVMRALSDLGKTDAGIVQVDVGSKQAGRNANDPLLCGFRFFRRDSCQRRRRIISRSEDDYT
jgi:hypothetical protein